MLAGHYASAFALSAAVPRAPLWALCVAAQAVDIAWSVFVVTGIEAAHVEPGFTASNGLVLAQVVYSHSLVGAFAWALGAGLLAFAWRRDAAVSLVLAAAVASHWFLDLPMHTPDLPLAGADSPKLGLGLWNQPLLAFGLEAGLLLLSGWAFSRRAGPPSTRWGRPALYGVLALLCVAGYFGPQPDHIVPTALTGLFVYLSLPALAARA